MNFYQGFSSSKGTIIGNDLVLRLFSHFVKLGLKKKEESYEAGYSFAGFLLQLMPETTLSESQKYI